MTTTANGPSRSAIITSARITEMPKKFTDPMPRVMVKVEGSDEEHELFDYFPDELSFTAGEFNGLTVDQALGLRQKKDVSYLRS